MLSEMFKLLKVGALVSHACAAAVVVVAIALPEASVKPLPTLRPRSAPSVPTGGVTTKVYLLLLVPATAVKVPLVPAVTLTSAASNPVTLSLNWKV